MKTVAIHLVTGFEEIEAITIIDVLRRAGINVIVASMTQDYLVNGAHEIPVKADRLFTEVDYHLVDMMILPGGMPGAANLDTHQGLKSRILDFHSKGKPIGAICAAPMVLGHMGLLEGRNAVCYPGFEKELKGAKVDDKPAVIDGNLITGRGVGAALNFSLEIVGMLENKEKAGKLAESLLVENWK
ncbi:MAG: DJ-1 family glyoxalase III [Prolixibacteraceae bacterium]